MLRLSVRKWQVQKHFADWLKVEVQDRRLGTLQEVLRTRRETYG